LKSNLDDAGVYEWSEVEDFVEKYFKGVNAQELSPIIDISAERFNTTLALEDKTKADYKIKAKHFVKIYGQMASIMPYEVFAWEKLFWYLKFLIPKLIIVDNEKDALDNALHYTNVISSTFDTDDYETIDRYDDEIEIREIENGL
jgi:type I restriction enzyme R subunit